MEKRGQFTFYRSYFEALMDLQEQERLPILQAIMAYALDGTEPKELSGNGRAVFRLIRPTLDSGRKMAAGGKKGKAKVEESFWQGSTNEKEREKENENEIEIEYEIEGEGDAEREDESRFSAFWAEYPRKIDKSRAFSVWKRLQPPMQNVMQALERWKRCRQWAEEDGVYVPSPAKWLRDECWKYVPEDVRIPCGAAGELGERELQAIRRLMEGS
ncbi:MAG: hypothetical protein IJB17_06120 [Oscillospiraceae bacterium]|nr:hypothetical protein [Oscillospiraceae bacterium]